MTVGRLGDDSRETFAELVAEFAVDDARLSCSFFVVREEVEESRGLSGAFVVCSPTETCEEISVGSVVSVASVIGVKGLLSIVAVLFGGGS